MADHNPQHRRPHFHRGRRGPDRRGSDRRAAQGQAPEPGGRESSRDASGIDVEQIMRDIRSRISQRHGIELTTQQIQELAARRLEAILEPRNVKPQLLEQLRKSAGAGPDVPEPPAIATYTFEDTTLYETHRGILRFFRKLLNPILKLFFNPTPLINALHTQAQINRELAAREIERERRQNEWNALQYELMQRVVTETARVSIEMQALSSRIESLGARVDFNEKRVRGLETVPPAPSRQQPSPRQQERQQDRQPQDRQQPDRQPQEPRHAESRPAEPRPQDATWATTPAATEGPGSSTPAVPGEGSGEGPRRRRRRRRGRRSGGGQGESATPSEAAAPGELDELDGADTGEGDEEEPADAFASSVASAPESIADAHHPEPARAEEPAAQTAPVPMPVETPVVPTPPPDEPTPAHPVDHADPGPEDR